MSGAPVPCGISESRFGSSPSGISVDPGDAHDLELARLAHVEDPRMLVAIERGLQGIDRDLRDRGGGAAAAVAAGIPQNC
jgi:hypothetical protein